MDFSRGVSIQEEKDVKIQGSWIPVTPAKSIPIRPEPISGNRQGNHSGRTNWSCSDAFPAEFFQGTTPISNGAVACLNLMSSMENNRGINDWEEAFAAKKRCSDHNVGSHTPAVQNANAGWDNIPYVDFLTLANAANSASAPSAKATKIGSINGRGNPFFPISYSQDDSNWEQSNSANILLVNQNYSNKSLNLRNNGNCPSQINQYGFPGPCGTHERSSPPRTLADAFLKSTMTFQFAPVTPDNSKRLQDNQPCKILNVSQDEITIQENNELQHKDSVVQPLVNSLSGNLESVLQTMVDFSSGVLSTPLKENQNPEKGGENGIDLNKTPEQKPKRKKHRPRVIIEGKPKRSPKAMVKQTTRKENPSGKRKYVRKNSVKVSSTQSADIVGDITDQAHLAAAKSCKRTLNFNLEGQAEDESHKTLNCQEDMFHSSVDGFSSRLAFKFNSESNCSSGTKSTVQFTQGVEVIVENPTVGLAFDLNHSLTQMLDDYISLPEKPAPTTPPPTRNDPPRETLKQLSRNINDAEMAGACQNSRGKEKGQHQKDEHICTVGIEHAIEPTGSAYNNKVQISKSQKNSNCSQHVLLAKSKQPSGSKRGHCHTTDETHLQSINMISAHYSSLMFYEEINQRNNRYHSNNSNLGLHFPETCKKRRTEKAKKTVLSSTSSLVAEVGSGARQATAYNESYANADQFASQDSQIYNTDGTKNPRDGTSNAESRASVDNLQISEFIQTFGQTERKTKKRSKGPTRARNFASLTANAECNTFLSTLPKTAPTSGDWQDVENFHEPQACVEALAVHNHTNMARKKRSKGLSIVNSVSYLRTDEVNFEKHKAPVYDYHQSLVKSRGPFRVAQSFNTHVDEIIQILNYLHINDSSNTILAEEQNALVPFGGDGQMVPFADGQMVPYEQFKPIKKLKPRPKVDLDPESDRVWKLLMGKESSNEVEGTDVDKEKWWEEERQIFRGRTDSFIARMHLIQGDRRFSQWKGSVLDSVIGVFLTQNVSDHLSSSAFMSLAARFPLKSPSNNRTYYEAGTNMYVEEPEVCILDSNDTITCHENLSGVPVYDEHMEERQMSNSSHESFGRNTGGGSSEDISKSNQLDICESEQKINQFMTQNKTEKMTTGEECASTLETDRALEDLGSSQCSDVSPQNSVDSSTLEEAGRTMTPMLGSAGSIDTEDRRTLKNVSSLNSTNSSTPVPCERIRSCSDSNSEEEDLTKACKSKSFNGSFTELLQLAGTTMLQECCSYRSGSMSLTSNSKNNHTQSEDTESDKRRTCLDMINGLKDSLSIHPSNSQLPLTGVPIVPSGNYYLHVTPNSGVFEVECLEVVGGEQRISLPSIPSGITEIKNGDCTTKSTGLMAGSASEKTAQQKLSSSPQAEPAANTDLSASKQSVHKLISLEHEACFGKQPLPQTTNSAMMEVNSNLPKLSGDSLDVESICLVENQKSVENKVIGSNLREQAYSSEKAPNRTTTNTLKSKRKLENDKKKAVDWDSLRKVHCNGAKQERSNDTMDSVDWEAVRCADVHEIAETIKERGMNNMLAERIKDFLNRIVGDHGSINLEWLRDIPPDKAKEYLLSVRGLGLKSVECVRLLTLHHLAFPVDTNVGRIAVRLGWVPLQPLPESLQLHLLELYPMQESIQKYLWPRLCTLDQRTLYELHYQMITFGKVFCTKSKPNCNACPMRAECKHFASAFASARLALPGPEEKGILSSTVPTTTNQNPVVGIKPMPLPQLEMNLLSEESSKINTHEPLVEEPPATPEPESTETLECDIEDAFFEDPDEIPVIKLNIKEFALNLQNYMQENMEIQDGDMSKALVALTPEATSIPMPKLKNMSRLRTEHQVYELPDSHPLLNRVERRVPGDICSYLLAIWTPGETAESIHPPERSCSSQISGYPCNEKTCFSCSSIQEANSQTVRGTLLIPCKTAMRGSFPLNGTYFQVNEVFADHDSSIDPIAVPRAWIWNLPRRTVLFGTSIPTIFKGQSTEEIQSCFWKGYVCVRGFDQKTRAPRPLVARFHFPASKLVRSKAKTS